MVLSARHTDGDKIIFLVENNLKAGIPAKLCHFAGSTRFNSSTIFIIMICFMFIKNALS